MARKHARSHAITYSLARIDQRWPVCLLPHKWYLVGQHSEASVLDKNNVTYLDDKSNNNSYSYPSLHVPCGIWTNTDIHAFLRITFYTNCRTAVNRRRRDRIL